MNEISFKIILIGDSGSGKSSLLARFVRDYFAEDYSVTVGVDFATKSIPIDHNYKVKLQIWDTAGQESFRSIVKTFYRNASAVLLVYDITRKPSLDSIRDLWLSQARSYAPTNIITVLIGTHLDLENQRQARKQDVNKLMELQEIDMGFETSSKTSENVAKAFQQIAKQLFISFMKEGRGKKVQGPTLQNVGQTTILSSQKKQKNCC